jgi:hypothetical protein
VRNFDWLPFTPPLVVFSGPSDGSSGDLMNELIVELDSNLSQNIVSLASFNRDYTVI